jgi:flavin-dependent dehydrogenase
LLAEQGCTNVTLFEKKTWPRPKTCAGGLGPRALSCLARHNVLGDIASSATHITGLQFTSPSGKSARLGSPREMALVLPREQFDAVLVDKSVKAGVNFRPDTRVVAIRQSHDAAVVETQAGAIEASAVIVATGAIGGGKGSNLPAGNCAGSIMARYENMPHNPLEMEMIYSPRILPYYAWLFPEPSGCVNIGLLANSDQGGTNLHTLFDHVLERYFGSRLGAARLVGRRCGAPLRCDGKIGKVVDGHIVLAGESAGLVNCTTGEGIAYAMESGELAAAAVIRAIEGSRINKTALSRYQRATMKRFATTLRVSAFFRGFVACPLFPAAADIGTHPLFQKISAFVLAKV